MKIIPKLTGLLVLALAGATAQASTYNFSYVFGDGFTTVTGSLDGNQNGLFVDNVTNVSVYFNGDALPGTVFTSRFDGNSYSYLAGPVVSFDVFQNNFAFANTDLAGGDLAFDSIFYIFNASVYSDTAAAFSVLGGSQDDPTVAASWSLTLAPGSSVPDQGTTLALLALSLVALGWLRNQGLSTESCATVKAR